MSKNEYPGFPKQHGGVIQVPNVNYALESGVEAMRMYGEPAESRGLKTLRIPGPILTIYDNPCERVLFNHVRDANPFFHLMESMWVLSGSDRVAMPKYFLDGITRYSDDGARFHGAYGFRLRIAFDFDQIETAVELLSEKPDTRQCVLSIWHPSMDLGQDTKDMPCNDMIMFDITDGKLNMTVCNRSNDMIWGAYGANAVQFSILQEYVAIRVGVPVGIYTQMSNNFHVYEDNPYWLAVQEDRVEVPIDPYPGAGAYPLARNSADALDLWDDCVLMEERLHNGGRAPDFMFESSFGRSVLAPAWWAYDKYKRKDYDTALEHLGYVKAPDWRKAMTEWVQRRAQKVTA